MRFRHPDGTTVHLAYCTNVHPAEDARRRPRPARDHCEPVRRRLGRRPPRHRPVARPRRRPRPDRRPAGAARPARRTRPPRPGGRHPQRLPLRGFGAEEVKYRVYRPDWTDPERLAHTTDLARLLAALLPDDVTEGSISTLPLAWRTPCDDAAAAGRARALTTSPTRLDALRGATGRPIRVGLEPEPGCVVETTADAIDALGGARTPTGSASASTPATSPPPSRTRDAALAALDRGGRHRRQGPAVQRPAAPRPPSARDARGLAAFAEPRFLHQTREPATAAGLRGTDDLDEALAGAALPGRQRPGAPTSTSRCTPTPAPPLTSTPHVLERHPHPARRRPAAAHPPPRGRDLHLAGPARPSCARATDAGLADGIAAELAWPATCWSTSASRSCP